MIKTELAQEAGMPNSARKGPVRTCKNYLLLGQVPSGEVNRQPEI